MTLVYIGVGSNVEREKHIRAAYNEVSQFGVVRTSTVYQCQPVGFDSHAFYNLVFELETSLDLLPLQAQLRAIELKWGRDLDAQKFQDRTLDLDILLFGDVVSEQKPIVPRSDIFKYEFVLQPLLELCPQLVVPRDGRTVEQIWQQFEHFKNTLTAVEFDF